MRGRTLSAPERTFVRWTPLIVCLPYVGSVGAAAWSWVYGVHSVHVWTLLAGYVITLLGVEVGFHRHFAHRAFQANPWVRIALGVAGSMAAQGPLGYWLATHLRHHALADEPGDPHSPHVRGDVLMRPLRGLVHAHTGWIFGVELAESYRYMPTSCAADPVIRAVNRYFAVWLLLGLAIPAAIGGLALGSWSGALGGLLWGGFVRIFLVDQAVFLVNSVCHLYGSRAYSTRDRSTNCAWLAPLTLGGSYHNNHHAFPRSARTSAHWWQPDPSYWFIASLERLGMAWDLKRAPGLGGGRRTFSGQGERLAERHRRAHG